MAYIVIRSQDNPSHATWFSASGANATTTIANIGIWTAAQSGFIKQFDVYSAPYTSRELIIFDTAVNGQAFVTAYSTNADAMIRTQYDIANNIVQTWSDIN